MQAPLARFKNISVFHIDPETTETLSKLVQRNMDVQISIQDEEVTWNSDEQSLSFMPEKLR